MEALTPITVLLRGTQIAALLSLFGTLLFAVLLAPAAVWRPLILLARVSAAAALFAAAGWFALTAAAIAGVPSITDLPAVLPTVLAGTRFGHLVVVRLGLLLVVLGLLSLPFHLETPPERSKRPALWRLILCSILTGLALALQAPIAHVGAIGGSLGTGLIVSETLHLFAAGAWLGSLLPLMICLRRLPAAETAGVCEGFSPLGLAAVLVIAGTALAQGLQLVGSIPALLGTLYGHLALLKALLFLIALSLAARNRLVLTDRLRGSDRAGAHRSLRRSIAVETLVGLLIVLTAGLLASVTPGTHQQPDWPLPVRVSFAALAEPDLRQEILVALLIIALGISILVASLVIRRLRVAAACLGGLLVAWCLPNLNLLLVPAYPTSFYTSPTGFSVTSIVQGETLFMANCTRCHGTTGRGDGSTASTLRVHPADLTEAHLRDHSDGELFWFLSHGIDDPEGDLAMPGFAGSLSALDRWHLIDYLRARNEGASRRTGDLMAQPIRAPDLPTGCNSAADTLTALRGRMVLILADPPPAEAPDAAESPTGTAAAEAAAGIPLVPLYLRDGANLRQGSTPDGCVSESADAWAAFAILAGVTPDALAGTAVLIDPGGWLRAVLRPASARDPARLTAAVRYISDHPVSPRTDRSVPGGDHDHHH